MELLAEAYVGAKVGTTTGGWSLRVFTFNAKLYADGSVNGKCVNNPAPLIPGTHTIGDVTQLIADGNEAKITFESEGVHYGSVVIDNGEGNNAEVDRVTGHGGRQ